MLLPTLLAVLTAIPAISAQTVVSTAQVSAAATHCTTRYGIYPLPTGTAAVPTWFTYTASTSTTQLEYTTNPKVTVTPSATTFVNVVSTTTTFSSTTTSTPPAVSSAAPAGFIPLLAVANVQPTGTGTISRIKRFEIEALDIDQPFKRQAQTPPGNTAGIYVAPNGTVIYLYRRYPHRVDCLVTTNVNETITTIITGPPQTVTLPQSTVSAQSTTTVSTTVVVTEVAPTPTIYAACRANNIVNHITDSDGNTLTFDRLIVHEEQGFPMNQLLDTNDTSPENCCIACQKQPFCEGYIYSPGKAPVRQRCLLQLTQPYTPYPAVGNNTSPTATGGVVPISTGVPVNGSCPAGSLTHYNGAIRGRENSPMDVAPSFGNGPCGRYTVDNRAIMGPNATPPLRAVKRVPIKRMIAM